MQAQIENLRLALSKLDATGPNGFEGLLAVILGELCGRTFRLSSSGSQGGRDGEIDDPNIGICFEAKLYTAPVPRPSVSDKLLEIENNDDGRLDTWILGATVPVSSQHVSHYRAMARRFGLGVLILDWIATGEIPPLAIAVAAARGTAVDHLRRNLLDTSAVSAASLALDAIASHATFASREAALREQVMGAALGLQATLAENLSWMRASFSNKRRARNYFGQPLAPRDSASIKVANRSQLVAALTPAFTDTPKDEVYVVTGQEGVGKSWLVAETWEASTPKPLFVLLTASEIESEAAGNLRDFLIGRLVQQLDSAAEPQLVLKRLKRRFKGWAARPNVGPARIVVAVDGVNQRPGFRWTSWIDAAAKELHDIGGRLIVTSRTEYFLRTIKNSLDTPVREVPVSQWTDDELRVLLSQHSIDAASVTRSVFQSLQNPRLLGIALELLGNSEIEGSSQLTVERLLFEHIKRCSRDGVSVVTHVEFTHELQQLATDFLSRLSSEKKDDVRLFNIKLEHRLRDVTATRFFVPVSGDPDLFEIAEDGLALALGLSIVSKLHREVRNGRDPSEQLTAILQPILALDRSAGIIASAVMTACLNQDLPSRVTASLIRGYVDIQNLNQDYREEFSGLVLVAPDAFLEAAKRAALYKGRIPNFDWLEDALVDARRSKDVWATMSRHLIDWLSHASISPMRLLDHLRDSDTRRQSELEERKTLLDSRIKSLTANERAVLDHELIRDDTGFIEDLHRLAFKLLAGMPLAPFARPLVRWCFSEALNTAIHSPREHFQHLVRFNRNDWHQTREALLREIAQLGGTGRSRVGDWAMVYVLDSTGSKEDGTVAYTTREELTKDRDRFGPWRRIEKYCSSDPCDPNASEPDNIDKTADDIRVVDVAKFSRGMSFTAEDHAFSDMATGLARYRSDSLLQVVQRLFLEVAQRSDFSRRQGVLAIVQHGAVAPPEAIRNFITEAQSSKADHRERDSSETDEWLTVQESLRILLPHLSGDEQLGVLENIHTNNLLVTALELLKPASEALVESTLAKAILSENYVVLRNVLCFLQYSRTKLSDSAVSAVQKFIRSKDSWLRTHAFGIAAATRNDVLIRDVAASPWSATSNPTKKRTYEGWYGSAALIAAAEKSLISGPELLERIQLASFGHAAANLDSSVQQLVADRTAVAFELAAKWELPGDAPGIKQSLDPYLNSLPQPFDSESSVALAGTVDDAFAQAKETDEEFEERQQRAVAKLSAFRESIRQAGADLVLENLSVAGISRIIDVRPELGAKWLDTLVNSTLSTFSKLHTFALQLSVSLASTDPSGSVALLTRAIETRPVIRRVSGKSEVPYEMRVAWRLYDLAGVKDICFGGIDRARADLSISNQVLSAQIEGKHSALVEYVHSRIARSEPSDICRALMVAGYSAQSAGTEELLLRYSGEKGFIGLAAEAARYAYDRNVWAEHWHRAMREAQSAEEFWRFSILFLKVVDARYDHWADAGSRSDIFEMFIGTLSGPIGRRVRKWNQSRSRTLYGGKVPEAHFLNSL